MKKITTFLLALVMVLSMASGVLAEEANTGSITITPPSGIADNVTNTYKIYKVFDAVGNGANISYKLVENKDKAPDGFTVDDAGNVTYSGAGVDGKLTAEDIAAIAAYVTEKDLVATVTANGATPAVAENLPNGYYFITTSTGTVVTIDSTNPNAEVKDKNVVPKLDKKITGASSLDEDGKKAMAQVGTSVNYEVTIKVEAGAKGYEFHDKMSEGLQYNNDVTVYVGDSLIDTSNYTQTKAEGDTITIQFNDEWIKTVIGQTITVKYSATINSDALHTDPAKNTAWLEYGDENSSNKTPVSETKVYNAKFTVTKTDGQDQPLAGAGFVIKNADDKYYKLTDNVVTWVDNIAEATEYKSDEKGNVPAFTGLANGTYTLVEKTVPAGYNKALDSTFTIKEHDYNAANLIQATTVVNQAGAELPSTGGMGTTLFYIGGGILVLAAIVLLVTKKRMSSAE